MKTITINGYLANELDQKLQQKLIQDYHEINVMSDWYQPIQEGFNEDLEKYGITARLSFSGFWSQGDGACFVTDTVDADLLVRKLHEEGHDIPEDCLLYSKDFSINVSKVHASFANHYDHENTVSSCVYNESDKISDEDLDSMEGVITEWVRQTSREVYQKLENYYIELTTDEAIMETLVENEYLFTESGTIIPS